MLPSSSPIKLESPFKFYERKASKDVSPSLVRTLKNAKVNVKKQNPLNLEKELQDQTIEPPRPRSFAEERNQTLAEQEAQGADGITKSLGRFKFEKEDSEERR